MWSTPDKGCLSSGVTAVDTKTKMCPGPLVWFESATVPVSAVLECASCDYVVTTGNFHDEAHENTPLMREGMA